MTTPTTPKAGDITEIDNNNNEIESLITGRNTHSVYHLCFKHGFGVNFPLENRCPSCENETYLYLSAPDIRTILDEALAKQKESIKEQLRMNKVPVELEIPRLFQPVSTRNQMGGYSSVPFYCSLCGMSECEIQDNKLNGAYNCDCSVWTSPCDGEWVQWHNKEKAQKFSENMPSEDTVWNKAVDKFNEKLNNL